MTHIPLDQGYYKRALGPQPYDSETQEKLRCLEEQFSLQECRFKE